MIDIFCDGACIPINPGGVATWGFIARRETTILAQACGVYGEGNGATNNVAEYVAIFAALQWAATISEATTIYSDSQLVVNQLLGKYQVNVPTLPAWRERCLRAMAALPGVTFCWIPHEENTYADALSQRAYARYRQTHRPQENADGQHKPTP